MPDDPSAPQPTPTNYQRTTGGHLRWQPPTTEHLQEMLPAYEILGILGQGGMGAVYKGRQKSLDRIVAIKILPPEAAENDMQFVERFKNEARTMAKMNHPSIVHVYDFGETSEGQLYIVMEFIDGTDVAQMIQSQGKLSTDHALAITAHVCDALGYAHKNGIVHRDIKPANIMINMEGQVKVADFGLAKGTDPKEMGLTKTNMAMGTPDFVSPEALMPGVPLDGRADLYAVGVMLYNMLTGTIPRGAFRMPSATLQTDARFDKIILKAMEMDRELRYQTALDLRRDLDVILTTPAAKTGVQTIPAQQAAAPQQSLPQKPMGRGPGSPQQRKEGGASTPARSAPAADKSVRAPAQAPKKSNAGMIYGIAAAVIVVAVAAFMLSGGGQKPAPATSKVAEESKPESKSAAPKVEPPKPTATSVPSSKMLTFSGHRYQLLTEQMTWDAAKTKAKSMGGHLVTITSKAEADFVREKLLSRVLDLTQNVGGRRLMLGGMQPKPGSPWQWITGERFDMSMWVGMQFEPKEDEPHYLNWDYGAKRWDHATARGSYFPLIEWDDEGTAKPAPVAATTAKPGEVLTIGGHRYQHVRQSKITWDAAKAEAARMGGHLATITSKAEHDFIAAKIEDQLTSGYHLLFGLSRDANSSEWRWVTGEPFSFSAWTKGQPDASQNLPCSANYWRTGTETKGFVVGWDDSQSINTEASGFLVEWDDDGATKLAPAASAAAVPVAATKDAPFVNTLGMKFVPVPGTQVLFSIWETRMRDYEAFANEVTVPGHWKNLPTINGVPVGDGSEHPVTHVSWEEATQFCDWLTKKEVAAGKLPKNAKYRLPTDEEWSAAVGLPPEPGTTPKDKDLKNRIDYPWGKTWPPPPKAGNYPDETFHTSFPKEGGWLKDYTDGYATTAPVGSFTPSPHGIYDLSGNVWEWCEDWFDSTQKEHFLRGGSYMDGYVGPETLLSSQRFNSGNVHDRKLGFRCVVAASSSVAESAPARSNPTAPSPAMSVAAASVVAPAPAIPAAPSDPRLAQLEAGYQARFDADAQKPFLAAVAALNQSYVANGIARSRAAAQAKGSLAEVTALDAEKTAIEGGGNVPAEDSSGTPDSLKTLRGTYRTACAKAAADRDAKAAPLRDLYLKALDAYVTELTKAGKLDEAKQVQALRDAKAAPKPLEQTQTTTSAPATTADNPVTSKMSEREVALWMLSMGAEISVQGMSGIKDVTSLPAGKTTITTGTIYCDKTTNAELGCLTVCRDMTTLTFRNNLPKNDMINLEPIRRLTKLRSLVCYPTRDSTGMEIIAGLKGLTQLTLGRTGSEALAKIAALKDLEVLRFAADDSPDFSALKVCKKILTLQIQGRPCVINDADVGALVATWTGLESLTLGENNNPAPITDAAIEELVKLRSLKELKLPETKISDAALAKLQKALPDCKVTK